MLVYISTFLIVFLSLRKYEKTEPFFTINKRRSSKLLYKYIAIIAVTLVFGLRAYTVGTDTINYLSIFNNLNSNLTWAAMIYEKGFCFLSIMVYKYFGSFTVLLLISGFIIYQNIVTAICELSQSPSVSALCYFGFASFAQSCNLLRQYIALSFCLMALVYLLKKKKILMFLFLVFLGFLFHKSALVFLIVLPLTKIKFKVSNILIVLTGIVVAIFSLPYILKFVDLVLGSHYYGYINIKSDSLSFFNIGMICGMLLVILCLIKFRKPVEKNTNLIKEYDFFANLFLIFFGLITISIFSAELVDRIAIYFLPSIFFLVPIILKTFKKYNADFCIAIMSIGFLIFLFYLLVIRGTYEILPYEFINLF